MSRNMGQKSPITNLYLQTKKLQREGITNPKAFPGAINLNEDSFLTRREKDMTPGLNLENLVES
jgi:hypothetical protein